MSLDKGQQPTLITVAVAQTDTVVVANANTRERIRCMALALEYGAAGPATVTFNSKGSGAGTAISPAFSGAANKTMWLSDGNWFQTNPGEALTVSTGAGTNGVGILIVTQTVSF